MPQPNTARAEEPQEQRESHASRPILLADNGHGTKVKLWANDAPGQSGIPNISIERSFKRKDSDQWETQKVSINAEDFLAVARGLEKGHDAVVDKQIGKQGQARS
jgi:hypothetical protein